VILLQENILDQFFLNVTVYMFPVSESNSKRLRMYGQVCTPHNCFSIWARSVLAKTSPMREISSVYEIFVVAAKNGVEQLKYLPRICLCTSMNHCVEKYTEF